MDYISLLLLDAGKILGPAIKEILESSAFHPIIYLKESVRELNSSNYKEYLSKVFSILRCDVAVLVLPPEFHDVSTELRGWLYCQSATQLPTLALIESKDRRSIFTSIRRTGGQTVERGPLTFTKFLPLVWHTTRYLTSTAIPRFLSRYNCEDEKAVGCSPLFVEESKKIHYAGNSASNVFISGAVGTGKRHFARMIHFGDKLLMSPFSVFCCGSLQKWPLSDSDSYFEFPSAESMAHKIEGGTLYLDEIDCLSDLAQVKLLHFLKNKNYLSFGSEQTGPANFRVIAGCNVEPEQILKSGKLRKDLYSLLSIISFKLPLLKHRKEDIPLLAEHFLTKFSRMVGKEHCFSPEAMAELVSYDWPGNLLELEYTIFRTISPLERKIIQESDIRLPARANSIASLKEQREEKSRPESRLKPRKSLSTTLAD